MAFLELAVLFAALAIVAAGIGHQGIAGTSMTLAKWFVFAFLILAILSLVM